MEPIAGPDAAVRAPGRRWQANAADPSELRALNGYPLTTKHVEIGRVSGGDEGPVDRGEHGGEFAALLDRRDIHMEFQPLVDLRSGEVVALEALARGPHTTAFVSPIELFAAARSCGRVAELDWVCRAAAFDAFLQAELPPSLSLFINTEPEGFAANCPPDLAHLVAKAESLLRVFVEVNGHALGMDPAGVLAAVDRAREMSWGVAVDDVGGSRVPVAMLPIVQADVVKLDLGLLKQATPEDYAATITSVLGHVEATGASLLVEQIESEADARWARALGAVYGQGLHLGAPSALRGSYPAPRIPVPLVQAASTDFHISSPHAVFEDRPQRRMESEVVDRLATVIANSPRSSNSWPVFLTCVGRDLRDIQGVMEASLGLPRPALLSVAFGVGMPDEPVPGVRGVRVGLDDPLANEKFLIVLSDQAAVALFAQRASDGLFDVVITQNQELVHGIAHHLIRRVPGPGSGNVALPARTQATDDHEEEHISAGNSPTSRRRRGTWWWQR